MKKIIEELIKKRRDKFNEVQRTNLTGPDSQRSFFKNVKAYSTCDRPREFDVRDLRPGKSDAEIAEELAQYFNRISAEFSGLQPDQIPVTRPRRLPILQTHEVAARIKNIRKPRSMVMGDVFPSLMTKFSDFFAIPLASIYNTITCLLYTSPSPRD